MKDREKHSLLQAPVGRSVVIFLFVIKIHRLQYCVTIQQTELTVRSFCKRLEKMYGFLIKRKQSKTNGVGGVGGKLTQNVGGGNRTARECRARLKRLVKSSQ